MRAEFTGKPAHSGANYEKGVSAIDAPGKPFFDIDANAALFVAIENTLRHTANRQLLRLPYHINDQPFADALVAHFNDVSASR